MFGTTNEDCRTQRKRRQDRQMEINDVSLRFYLAVESDDDVRHDVRSVKVRRQTTVEDILPTLRDKFQLQVLPEDIDIYTVTDLGEIPLPPPACPLDIVLQSDSAPRFVVRVGGNGELKAQLDRRRQEKDNNYANRRQLIDATSTTGEKRLLLGQTGNRGAPVIQNDLPSCQKRRTPDLVGDCRRRPIIPSIDYKPTDADSPADWLPLNRTAKMLGSDSNLDQVPDAISSDASFGASDSVASDSGFGRKRSKRRRRTKSRDTSADSREPNFKSAAKRGGSLRSSKSMSSLFQKTFSLRKKDELLSHKTELSTEECSPGILKVFGDSITPGANYKSVLAVTTSTSRELVKEALERYGIAKRKSGHYVLCDVIGHFMNYSSDLEANDDRYSLSPDNSLWTEECIRIIGDNERPLVLQKFWKPSEGYARRFELRKRSDLMIIEDRDTSGVNANVRRLLMSKVKYDSTASSIDSTSELESVQGAADDEPSSKKFNRNTHQPRRTVGDRRTNERRDERTARVKTPTTCPFLVSLHGYDPSQDCALFPIAHRCVKVGSDRKLLPKNLYLTAPDILLKHCELRLSMRTERSSALDARDGGNGGASLRVQIHIHEGADVRINGIPKTSRMELRNGDIIDFGDFYQFLYRDPYAPKSTAPDVSRYLSGQDHRSVQPSRVQSVVGDVPVSSPRVPANGETPTATDRYDVPGVENSALEWRLAESAGYDDDQSKLKLAYSMEREDELLQMIINLTVDRDELFTLTPAYLLSMAVDYSAAKHDQICTRTLLLKLATKIHNSVLRRARTLAEKQASQSNDPHTATGQLLSDLCPIIVWMVNALELFHHFRQHLIDYLMDPELSLTSQTRASVATAGDEVIGTLEEVVMYTFQQTVYYLTKALYICLPAITEGNPFQDDSRTDTQTGRPTMDYLIAVYQMTLERLRDYKLHPGVVSQLFCYLFFFTSTSVFNSLMSKGCADKHFRWSRGVQIRGNLDCLEAWAVKNNFSREAATYLKKVVSLANLLSTPKVQLIKSSWMTLRESFPDLNPAQLHHILSNYEDGRFSQTWQPTSEDAHLIQNSEMIESFDGHPPLRLPTDGFHLNLNSDVDNAEFYNILNDINAHFGITDDDVDSGLSVSQNFSATELPRLGLLYNDEASGDSSKAEVKLDTNPISPTQSTNLLTVSKSSYFISGRSPNSEGLQKRSDNLPTVCTPKGNLSSDNRQESSVGKERSNSILSSADRSSPAEDQRFRPIETPPSASEQCTGNDRRKWPGSEDGYSYGTRQRASFSSRRSGSDVPSEYNRTAYREYPSTRKVSNGRPSTFTPAGCTNRSTSFSYAGKSRTPNHAPTRLCVNESRRSHDESPLYANLSPRTARRRDPSGSLNSSISSQISRDGNEVYHYMKDALTVLEGESGSVSTESRPQIRQTSPLYGKQTNRVAHSAVKGVADICGDKSAMNENIRKNDFFQRQLASTDLLRTSKGSSNDASSQSLDVSQNPTPHSSSLLATIHCRQSLLAEDQNDVFAIELPRGPMGFGMGLIDGLHTPLRQPGIYIRTLVAGSPAQMNSHLRLGDRILAVNGSSVLGVDYSSAMQAIKDAGDKIRLKVVHNDGRTVMSVTASPC